MIDYNEAIKVGIEAYIAKKGMDETFLRNEVIPCLKEMVKEKAIAGEIDQQFIKLSEAVIVLEAKRVFANAGMISQCNLFVTATTSLLCAKASCRPKFVKESEESGKLLEATSSGLNRLER